MSWEISKEYLQSFLCSVCGHRLSGYGSCDYCEKEEKNKQKKEPKVYHENGEDWICESYVCEKYKVPKEHLRESKVRSITKGTSHSNREFFAYCISDMEKMKNEILEQYNEQRKLVKKIFGE